MGQPQGGEESRQHAFDREFELVSHASLRKIFHPFAFFGWEGA
jgi:hypothetical protein